MIRRYLSLLALLLIFAAGLFSQSNPVARMRNDVAFLTADSLMGRAAGTKGEAMAARFIERAFEEGGATLLYPAPGQDFSLVISDGDTINSSNIIAIAEGWDPLLREEFIVIGAHYDHLGYVTLNIDGRDSLQIFSGADDNASGVAVLLQLARMISSTSIDFRRSVLFIAFGAEERGMVGSWYFTNRAFAGTDKISLMINLDMVGRGADRDGVRAHTVTPNTELVTLLKDVSDMPLMITPQIHTTDYFPSDHRVFATLGIPVVLFTTGMHRDYHSVRDTPDKLNYKTMEHLTHYIYNVVKEVANMERPLRRTPFAVVQQDISDPDRVYDQNEVDKRATYNRGDERNFLNKWVYHYLRYPAEAIVNGIQGRVIVEFVVEKNGELSNITINKSAGTLLDQEALRVINASPKWKAASVGGKPVRSKISIPVEFRLKR